MRTIVLSLILAISIQTKAQVDNASPCNCLTDTIDAFITWEKVANFPGGQEALMNYLIENVVYPKQAIDSLLEDRVYISFCVRVTGQLTDIKIVKGKHKVLNDEALRVISSMPNWEPAKSRGKNVCFAYTIPINFELDKKTKRGVRKEKAKL